MKESEPKSALLWRLEGYGRAAQGHLVHRVSGLQIRQQDGTSGSCWCQRLKTLLTTLGTNWLPPTIMDLAEKGAPSCVVTWLQQSSTALIFLCSCKTLWKEIMELKLSLLRHARQIRNQVHTMPTQVLLLWLSNLTGLPHSCTLVIKCPHPDPSWSRPCPQLSHFPMPCGMYDATQCLYSLHL